MGHYIQGPPHGKALLLVHEEKATLLPGVEAAKQAFSEGMGVICVVDNGPFAAAAFAFSMDELEVFAYPDGRPKTWLAMDLKRVMELTEFPPDRYEGPSYA